MFRTSTRTARRDSAFAIDRPWIPRFGIRYQLGVDGLSPRARAPHDGAHGLGPARLVRPEDREAQGLRRGVPPPRDGDAREPRRARHAPLLRVLGSDARPDVLHHRDLGRQAPHLRHDEVLPLHDGGLAPHVPRDPLRGGVHLARRASSRSRSWTGAGRGLRRLGPDAGRRGAPLRRVHARFPREGPALAAPHVASRRARRGPDGRLDHPRGRPPEARDVRPPALRVPAVPARRGARTARSSPSSRSWASSTAPGSPPRRRT